MRPVRVDARSVPFLDAVCDRLACGAGGNGIVLARLVGPLLPRRPLEGSGTAFVVDAKGPDLRGDRRHRRRPHHVVAGAAWWGTQLGLPLLLAARRDLYADGTGVCRLPRRGAGVGAMAPAHRGGKPAPAPDHVWLVRRTTAHRVGSAVAARLPGCRASACWQRSFRSTSARRVRRAHRRHLPGASARCCSRRVGLGAATEVDRASGANLGAARRWYLGSEGRSPPLYLFQDHGVGGSGSHGARCWAVHVPGTAGILAETARSHAPNDLRAWIR